MASTPLYELSHEYAEIQDMIAAADGEFPPEVFDKLTELEGAIEHKAEAICRIVADAKADAMRFQAEMQRLAERKRIADNTASRLLAYLLAQMRVANLGRLKTELFDVSVCKNARPSIEWPGDPAELPLGLTRTMVSVDGTAAYEAWKQGTLPEGFKVERGEHLRVR